MKQKSKRKKKSSAAKSSSDGAAPDGSKKNLEEEKRDDEGKKDLEKTKKSAIESLIEAFCSISLEEATAAYNEAGGDLNKAAEILSVLTESGDDPSTSSSMSSGQETGSSSDYGLGSSLSCSEELNRERYTKKHSRVIAATGMVSSVIGKDYMKPNPVQKELCRNGKKAGDREEAEQFLNSMLGDDCDLSMAVVREVLCEYFDMDINHCCA